MKIRNGYVSNSSSSSFICQISGRVEAGYDMSISDAGMYECVNGHTFDEDYVIEHNNKDLIKEYFNESIKECQERVRISDDPAYYIKRIEEEKENLETIEKIDEDEIEDEFSDEFSEMRYELPSAYCPICQMKHIIDQDLISYLLKELNKKRENVEEDIRVKFDDFDTFKKNIK